MAKGKKTGGRKPGSGNKVSHDIKQLAQVHGKKAIAYLYKLLKDKSQPASIRLTASKELLDRGYGRASQVIDSKVQQTIDIVTSDVELARRAAYLLAKTDLATDPNDPEYHVAHPPQLKH